jgi:hypothetical protein
MRLVIMMAIEAWPRWSPLPRPIIGHPTFGRGSIASESNDKTLGLDDVCYRDPNPTAATSRGGG